MDQQEQRTSNNLDEKMNELKDSFNMNASLDSLKQTKALLNSITGIVQEELAKGDIKTAVDIKNKLTKHVPLEEVNKMMNSLNKFYDKKK